MLDEVTISLLKDNQLAGIEKKTLTKEQLELIYANKWFLIWVPKEFGGLELGLEEGCSLLEELAYIDGGLSWTVTLCAGANMFVGFIDQALARDIFANSQVCFGGSGKVGGKTEKVSGGYLVSGTWSYATGAPHLTHFTANCPVTDASNGVGYKSFFFNRDDVLIHYDWDTFGLEVTASHSFSVENLFVPESYTFDILPEQATSTSPLFRIPFMPFAEATLYINYAGMFRRFCDLVFRYYSLKASDSEWMAQYGYRYFDQLDDARQIIENGREHIHGLIRELWGNIVLDKAGANDPIYEMLASDTRKQVRLMKEYLVALFPSCGIAAAQRDNEMNMVFRNFFTATQHALLNRKG